MRLKGLCVAGITIFIVFVIYLSTLDHAVYYLSMGDFFASGKVYDEKETCSYTKQVKEGIMKNDKLEKFVSFTEDSARVPDMIRLIENNQTIKIKGKDQTIKNALIKADIVTISIGSNDLFYQLGIRPLNKEIDLKEAKEEIDEMMHDYDKLFQLMRQYCKEDIAITGFYNPVVGHDNNTVTLAINYANRRLSYISKQYHIKYIDIDEVLGEKENYLSTQDTMYPTCFGYKATGAYLSKQVNNILFGRD